MHILIIGAAGMVGAKLTSRLVKDGSLAGKPIDALTLVDVIQPAAPAASGIKVATEAADLSTLGTAERIASNRKRVPSRLTR